MVFLRDILTAPFASEIVTIIGNISGVSPTATDKPKSRDSSQSPLLIPLIKKTTRTMHNMKRIKIHDTELTPFSKLVLTLGLTSSLAMTPKMVRSPVATTTPTAVPLITLLPKKARLLHDRGF